MRAKRPAIPVHHVEFSWVTNNLGVYQPRHKVTCFPLLEYFIPYPFSPQIFWFSFCFHRTGYGLGTLKNMCRQETWTALNCRLKGSRFTDIYILLNSVHNSSGLHGEITTNSGWTRIILGASTSSASCNLKCAITTYPCYFLGHLFPT